MGWTEFFIIVIVVMFSQLTQLYMNGPCKNDSEGKGVLQVRKPKPWDSEYEWALYEEALEARWELERDEDGRFED